MPSQRSISVALSSRSICWIYAKEKCGTLQYELHQIIFVLTAQRLKASTHQVTCPRGGIDPPGTKGACDPSTLLTGRYPSLRLKIPIQWPCFERWLSAFLHIMYILLAELLAEVCPLQCLLVLLLQCPDPESLFLAASLGDAGHP